MIMNEPESTFTLPSLSPWHKSNYLRYAEQVLTTQQSMQTPAGKNIIHYTLGEEPQHVQMKHYPKGDRIDNNTGSQYFYHCHRENKESLEHGHFHCFLRQTHIPKRIKPAVLADSKKNRDNPFTHLIAISMNCYGQPIRLFTVNRWVTGEIWYDAHHTRTFAKRFKMTANQDSHWKALDQWIEGIIFLFSPQIMWLQQQRDNMVLAHHQQNPSVNFFENKDQEELSSLAINLNDQIQWILAQ